MANYANYCVSEVRYSSDRKMISQVKVHVNNEGIIGFSQICYRSLVVAKLKQGFTFCTILKNSVGGWNKGADIHLVGTPPDEYIRTDPNSTQKDNLENLPEF
ncbi:MAG: DUF3892 domain-containing protein [Leptospiraceae bacterium]|nr:DUF3892 domain-containing protein [Leptospiraceae bacterium]